MSEPLQKKSKLNNSNQVMSNDTQPFVVHARYIVPVVPANTFLEHHALCVKDSKIVAILPSKDAKLDKIYKEWKQIYLAEQHVLIPGLVNAHTHAAMTLLRGYAEDCDLMTWLTKYIWPAEAEFVEPDFVRVGTTIACAEMLENGCTAFADMYFFAESSAEVVDKVGMRAMLGAVVIRFPSKYAKDEAEYVSKGIEFIKAYEKHDRISVAMAPHSCYMVSDDGLKLVAKACDDYKVRLHTHMHESDGEVQQHMGEFEGARPFDRLRKHGLLRDTTLLAHMTQLSDEERAQVAAANASVAHCPESNMKLASGFCDVHKLLSSNVNVAIGTDGAASNDDLDMLGELRSAALVDKHCSKGAVVTPAHRMLEMATLGGARALGLDDRIGSLEVGKCADFVAVALRSAPVYNPISHLVYVGTNRVTHAWVNGVCLYEDEKHTTIDVSTLRDEANAYGERIMKFSHHSK